MNRYVTPYIPQTVNGVLNTVLPERDRQDQITFRFDHRINGKQNFSAYYYVTDENDFNPFNTFQAAVRLCLDSVTLSSSASNNTI